jgi:galactose mutarotase-like enzyme
MSLELWSIFVGTSTLYGPMHQVSSYTANYLDGVVSCNATRGLQNEAIYGQAGVCLETQHYPDSPHGDNDERQVSGIFCWQVYHLCVRLDYKHRVEYDFVHHESSVQPRQ